MTLGQRGHQAEPLDGENLVEIELHILHQTKQLQVLLLPRCGTQNKTLA